MPVITKDGRYTVSSREYSVAPRPYAVGAIRAAGGVYFPAIFDQAGCWMSGGYSVGNCWNIVNTFREGVANPTEFDVCAELLGTTDLCVVAGPLITVPHVPMLLVRGEEEFESRLVVAGNGEVVSHA